MFGSTLVENTTLDPDCRHRVGKSDAFKAEVIKILLASDIAEVVQAIADSLE